MGDHDQDDGESDAGRIQGRAQTIHTVVDSVVVTGHIHDFIYECFEAPDIIYQYGHHALEESDGGEVTDQDLQRDFSMNGSQEEIDPIRTGHPDDEGNNIGGVIHFEGVRFRDAEKTPDGENGSQQRGEQGRLGKIHGALPDAVEDEGQESEARHQVLAVQRICREYREHEREQIEAHRQHQECPDYDFSHKELSI